MIEALRIAQEEYRKLQEALALTERLWREEKARADMLAAQLQIITIAQSQ